MLFLKTFFNFYINSSIHVAFAVYALTWLTLREFNLPYDVYCLNFIGLASITGYNFVKYFGLAQFHHRSLTNKLRCIQLFSALVFFVMLYYFFQLNIRVQFTVCVLGLMTFLYAIPAIPKHYLIDEHKNLRQISGLKVYVIALVWTLVSVVLPLQNADYGFSIEVVFTAIQRFLFVLILMLPFEIRDLNYDNLKLATIPQQIGIKKTKILGCLLLMIFFFLEFFKDELSGNHILIHLSITTLTLLAVLFSKQKQSYFYTAFWVESLPILWFVFYWYFTR